VSSIVVRTSVRRLVVPFIAEACAFIGIMDTLIVAVETRGDMKVSHEVHV
jgi:hypothetical protein